MRWVLLVLCGGVVPWLVGCAGVASSYAEREIERRAAEYLGPADRYDADVRGLTASSARQVVLVGTRVRPRPQLVLDTLTLDLRGVAYRRDPF
ncbi:MAG TPA: hypothetical protein PK794_01940, partial [Armatimonadota bacterium]|nr:hypothetical protein [Armatimonadota bacterium]